MLVDSVDRRQQNSVMVTHVGKGGVRYVPRKERDPRAPQFGVPLVMSLSFDAEQPKSAW